MGVSSGFPKGPQPLGTLTLLARSSVLYLCEGDYTFVKEMALTAASASSRRAAFLLAHPRSKGIPVTFSPALFRYREATS